MSKCFKITNKANKLLTYILFFCLDTWIFIMTWKRFELKILTSMEHGTGRWWSMFPDQLQVRKGLGLVIIRYICLSHFDELFSSVSAKAYWWYSCFQEQTITAQKRCVGALDTQRLNPQSLAWSWEVEMEVSLFLLPPHPTPNQQRKTCRCLSMTFCSAMEMASVFLFHKHS